MKNKRNIIITLLLVVLMFTLTGCNSDPEDLVRPIQGFTEFWDIFVYPMAGIMWVIGKTIGFGNYPLTIILSTLVVRTIAWPIYAKTNDMQLKMQLVQPEMEKIEKYISTIEDIEIRLIFSKRYLDFKDWVKIADEMFMSERSVYRKHSNWLKQEPTINQVSS